MLTVSLTTYRQTWRIPEKGVFSHQSSTPCSYEPVAAGARTTHPKPASAGNYPKSSSVNSTAITNSITSTGQRFIGVGHYHSQNTPTNSTT